MDRPHQLISPLLLKNGGTDKNMCSLNSDLQLLRHVPEFMNELENIHDYSALVSTLHSILSTCGNLQPSSAILLRDILAQTTGRNFNSGDQKDTVELHDYLCAVREEGGFCSLLAKETVIKWSTF